MTATTTESHTEAVAATPGFDGTSAVRHRSLMGYLLMPIVLVGVLVVLYIWVYSHDLSSATRVRLEPDFVLPSTGRHLLLTFVSTVFVLLIAIPVGVLLTRRFARSITPAALAFFNVGQGIPTIGLLALLVIPIGIGFWTAIVGLVAYTSLAVLRNTMVGLTQVDASVIEAARGMGMTRLAVLARIELPLAIPVMMAGVRTALIINVGTATLGTFVGAGGLGDIINTGIVQTDELVLVTGSVLVAVLALFVDYFAGLAEDFLRPRGL